MPRKKQQPPKAAAPPATPPQASHRGGAARSLALVLTVALVVKVTYLLSSRGEPFFEPTLLDSKYYHQWALRIVAGDLAGGGVFYGLPLYPYFLALCYALFGGSVFAAKLVQVVLGLVTLLFTYKVGARLADRKTGLLAVALAALYGPLFFHETMLIPEALSLPLYAAGFYACCLFLDAPSVQRGVIIGVLLGLACLTKAGIMLFVALFVGALLLRPRLAAAPPTRGALVALAASFIAVLAPVTLHNRLLGNDWVGLTSHGGLNFYIGNNPEAQGIFRAPEGTGTALEAQIADSRAIAEAAAGRPLKPSEISAYWSGKARAFIREHPVAFLRLAARKLLLAFDARELSDLQDYHSAASFNPLMRAPWLSFAVLGPLVLSGLVLATPASRYRWCLYLWIGAYLAGLVTFFVNARYRLPLLSVMFPLAALSLRTLLAAVQACAWPRLALYGAVLVAAIGVTQLRLVPLDPARDFVNAANVRLTARDYTGARTLYEKALALNPDNGQASLGMGIVLAQLGRADEAGAFYGRSVAASPDALAYNNLGAWYEQRGNHGEAEEAFRRAIELKPHLAQAHDNLGILYARRGESERAIEAFRMALKYDPKSCKAAVNLGAALRQSGRLDEARQEWLHAVQRDPACETAARALASAP